MAGLQPRRQLQTFSKLSPLRLVCGWVKGVFVYVRWPLQGLEVPEAHPLRPCMLPGTPARLLVWAGLHKWGLPERRVIPVLRDLFFSELLMAHYPFRV